MKTLCKAALTGLLGFLFTTALSAQLVVHDRLLSFEESDVPSFVTASKSVLSLSSDHYKDGSRSLQWKYQPGGVLTIQKELCFEKKDPSEKDLYLSTFVVWVYNAVPVDETVRFEFLKEGNVCASFPFHINFKGWRAAWVCYERDMEGIPEEGMNEIRIVAPAHTPGELYIDHLLTAAKTDPRHQTPDMQVPFVNKATDSHWLVLYKNSFLKPDIALTPLDEKQKQEMQLIEKRFRELIYTPSALKEKDVETLRAAYDKYQITVEKGQVKGMPIFFARAAEAYERIMPDWNNGLMGIKGVEVKNYFDLMNRIAVAYNNASEGVLKAELKQMFLSMYAHITDQGVSYGSCWGNFTHYGYSFRGLYTAYFLMKDVLTQAGLLNEAEKTLLWYAITKEVYVKPTGNGIDMDSFNTQTTGRIASILMMEDTPEKLQYLRSFARWIDYGCRPALGLAGAFKKDGGAFHHRNNYPAYAVGGLDGATSMVYLLSKTSFAVSPLAHETVKNVLLTMRFYCNKENFPLAMSGRHPDGKGTLIPIHYATLALAGTPDGQQEIDGELAAAYLRLVSAPTSVAANTPEYMPQVSKAKECRLASLFTAAGLAPEAHPQGNLALGYGCVSVQRRGNWSAVVRGHSRYLWAAEHYLGANWYGRYLAHGSMQLFTASPGQDVTPATSGWQQEGFDWNRVPGVTSIHLPLEELCARIYNVDAHSGIEEMLYSDEAFAGGLSQQRTNGNFGMKLHEHDKYNGSHRARKSWHFFDGVIVCLGSDIENTNSQYPTETTIFQLAMTDPAAGEYWNTYQGEGRIWMDHLSTGYYVPVAAKFDKHFPQHSRTNSTRAETKGDWVSLVIDHGKAPHGASYEYAVLPQTRMETLKRFADKPSYEVLQRNREAHIVRLRKENITSYVLFETPKEQLPAGLVQKADTSCLLMVHEQKGKALLTVAQPDLALYRGVSDEAFDENGKRIERSIYSRPWIDNDSGEIAVTVTLKGAWTLQETPTCQVLSSDKKQTVVRFLCRDGASQDVELIATVL